MAEWLEFLLIAAILIAAGETIAALIIVVLAYLFRKDRS